MILKVSEEEIIKAVLFTKHIQLHLVDMSEVKDKRPYCKICNKDMDTIVKEMSKDWIVALPFENNPFEDEEVSLNSPHD